MDGVQRKRFESQIRLPNVGDEGQRRLLDARVVIMGLGGLGSPASMYLAAAGIGHLVLVDFDRVELSNLQRQIVHGTPDLGRAKVDSARERLLHLNPGLDIAVVDGHLDDDDLSETAARADVVLDCTDNFETRFQLNRACCDMGTPLVSGAAIRFYGQVAVFDFRDPASPCYRCLYQDGEDLGEACIQLGILGPVVGIIGCVQALEAIKLILGLGDTLCGRLAFLDALSMDWRTIRLRRDPACPICSKQRTHSAPKRALSI
jgi:molybdopterin/thiamine biosynthesis adenylyltransferase